MSQFPGTCKLYEIAVSATHCLLKGNIVPILSLSHGSCSSSPIVIERHCKERPREKVGPAASVSAAYDPITKAAASRIKGDSTGSIGLSGMLYNPVLLY